MDLNRFSPTHFGQESSVRASYPWDVPEAEEEEHLERYSIAESNFLDCLKIDQYGVDRTPLPPALTPEIGLKFRTFDARIDAKYGVRNYLREIARYYNEIDEALAKLIPGIVDSRDPLAAAMAIVRMYSEAHVYDVQVRRTKQANRRSIYVRSLEPRACTTRVVEPDLENVGIKLDYEEDLLVLVQREILLGKDFVETMWALQPVGFTYHAMLRLWERGRAGGRTFHTIMADAFERLRGVTALVELGHLALGSDALPSQIAVPILDGFPVASSRHTLADSDERRWGFKRDRHRHGRLEPKDDIHFPDETCVSDKGRNFTDRATWFAATFMGANDIGGWERVFAARRFNELVEPFRMDEIARYREWLDRSLTGPDQPQYNLSMPDPVKLIELQQEMLPRAAEPDGRWHLLSL